MFWWGIWASETSQIDNKKWGNYYKNLVVEDVTNVLNLEEIFSEFTLEDKEKDIRFVGIKIQDN